MDGPTFAERRDSLIRTLADLAATFERADVRHSIASARALAEKLRQDRFNVVMTGAFKRGKSTLVNAIIGDDLLPTAVIPLTSVVTCVTWGEEAWAEVLFTDGHSVEVPAQTIARYATERENPGNGLGVERVLVKYPAPDLADGIFLVDTPGVGSIYHQSTEAARAFLPEADAAIFVTSADPPVSDEELSFLEEVRGIAERVFVVLNKIDQVPDAEREDVIAFTREVVSGPLGRDVCVYPVSARLALAAKLDGQRAGLERSGLPAFERDFSSFLLRDKGTVLLAATAARARSLIDERLNEVLVEERALDLSQDQLAAAVAQLDRVFADAERARGDLRTLLARDTKRLVASVEDDLAELRSYETARLLTRAGALLDEGDRIRPAELEQHVRTELQADLDRWRAAEEARVTEAYRAESERFVGEADRLVSRTTELAGEALGIELSIEPASSELSRQSSFSYHFFEVPTILESLLPDLRERLPHRLVRRLTERDLRARIPQLVDKHCGRIRYDFAQRLDRSRLALQRTLDDRLQRTMDGIREAAGRSVVDLAEGTVRAAERRSALQGQRDELLATRRRLEVSDR